MQTFQVSRNVSRLIFSSNSLRVIELDGKTFGGVSKTAVIDANFPELLPCRHNPPSLVTIGFIPDGWENPIEMFQANCSLHWNCSWSKRIKWIIFWFYIKLELAECEIKVGRFSCDECASINYTPLWWNKVVASRTKRCGGCYHLVMRR